MLALYLYKLSGGLVVPAQTNTGLLFVTKDNVDPYQTTQTRYEGSATDKKLVPRSGPIAHAVRRIRGVGPGGAGPTRPDTNDQPEAR